jgi:hypothetical protein
MLGSNTRRSIPLAFRIVRRRLIGYDRASFITASWRLGIEGKSTEAALAGEMRHPS